MAARLPYPPRPGQERLVELVEAVQRAGGHLAVEAGTGTGKTVAVAAASLAARRADGRRLLYATRTNSQQTQVLREHQALRAAGQDPGLVVPFMGRRHFCPLLKDDARFREGTPEELGRLCRDAKARARQAQATGRDVEGACPYFRRLLEDGPEPVEALLRAGVPSAADLADRVATAGSCPYEALKMLLPRADVVVLPFVFLLDERLRRSLLEWLGTGADGLHLVVDEAHNLPAAARDHHSPRLALGTLQRAQREAEEFQDPVLAGRTLTTTLLDALLRTLDALVDEYVHPQGVAPGDGAGTGDAEDAPDGLVPPDALQEALLERLAMPSPMLGRLAADLEQWGEIVREQRRSQGRLPRSYLGAVGAFLQFWLQEREAPYVHLATGGSRPALEAFLLDPAAVLGWLHEFWSTVHMSGTLRPLEEHRDLCGLGQDARLEALPSPFDPDRLRLYGLEGVHRRHEVVRRDPTVAARQQEAARALLAGWTGRIGCFFPSHAMLRDYVEEGFLHGLDVAVHAERPGMANGDLVRLVEAFRRDPAPRVLLLGVLGGRLTEGIDFPGDAMEHMLVFGVPYPRPTARLQALVHHFDRRLGQGWQVAVHHPTARVLRQAIGRLIRGPEDQGTAVVLDERVVRFRTLLPRIWMVRTVAEVDDARRPEPDGFQAASRLRVAAPATLPAARPASWGLGGAQEGPHLPLDAPPGEKSEAP